MIDKIFFKKSGLEYYKWNKKNPVGSIPSGVAREGAGENRIPFAHFANSLPVYLTLKDQIGKSNLKKISILDVGCGTGRNITFVRDMVNKPDFSFYGVDYSYACINYARHQYNRKNLIFIQHEGKTLPFPDKSFDFIVSSHVLEHIPKKYASIYIEEISRVLKEKGTAIIGTPNRKYCQDLFSLNPTDNKKYRLILPHEHEYYFQELKNLFKKNKTFSSITFYGTINQINRKLMITGAEKIKPKKGIVHGLKFSVYSLLRKSSRLQDLMARIGTELILRNMKVNYKDIIENTNLIKDKAVSRADNFIVIAS